MKSSDIPWQHKLVLNKINKEKIYIILLSWWINQKTEATSGCIPLLTSIKKKKKLTGGQLRKTLASSLLLFYRKKNRRIHRLNLHFLSFRISSVQVSSCANLALISDMWGSRVTQKFPRRMFKPLFSWRLQETVTQSEGWAARGWWRSRAHAHLSQRKQASSRKQVPFFCRALETFAVVFLFYFL